MWETAANPFYMFMSSELNFVDCIFITVYGVELISIDYFLKYSCYCNQVYELYHKMYIAIYYNYISGTDEHGEPCHAGMYRHLWCNAPKEALELPDYTFHDHYGCPTPSYLPRTGIRDYLIGKSTRRVAVVNITNFCKAPHFKKLQ